MADTEADIGVDWEQQTRYGSEVRKRLTENLIAKSPREKAPMRHLTTFQARSTVDEEAWELIRPSLITAFLYFKSRIDPAETKKVMKERLCEIPRFKSTVVRVVEGKEERLEFQLMREHELDMALDELVTEIDDVKNQQDLDAFITKMYSERLDKDLPLWRIFLIKDMADGRSLLIFVVDHTIADGTALMQVLMSILDDPASLPMPKKRDPNEVRAGGPSCCRRGCNAIRGLGRAFWGPFVNDQLGPDAPNRLKTKNALRPGVTKALCMTKELTMKEVKDVKNRLTGDYTINDILMTVTTLTLRMYFEKYEPGTLKQSIRANFPINMRKVAGAEVTTEEHFGNRFSVGDLTLPIHLNDPLKIISVIKSEVDVIKVSPEPWVRDKLYQLLVMKSGLSFEKMSEIILQGFGKVTAMLSNVPGPVEEVTLMGQPLDDLGFYCLAPFGLYFGIVQYKGVFKVGICVDAECEPDAAKLGDFWYPAFEALKKAAGAQE